MAAVDIDIPSLYWMGSAVVCDWSDCIPKFCMLISAESGCKPSCCVCFVWSSKLISMFSSAAVAARWCSRSSFSPHTSLLIWTSRSRALPDWNSCVFGSQKAESAAFLASRVNHLSVGKGWVSSALGNSERNREVRDVMKFVAWEYRYLVVVTLVMAGFCQSR